MITKCSRCQETISSNGEPNPICIRCGNDEDRKPLKVEIAVLKAELALLHRNHNLPLGEQISRIEAKLDMILVVLDNSEKITKTDKVDAIKQAFAALAVPVPQGHPGSWTINPRSGNDRP